MTATGHALVGTLIAAKFTNPLIGLPLSFLSHFVADILPHWDSGTHARKKTKTRLFYESVADFTLSIISSYILYTTLLSGSDIPYLYFNVFLSQLPDWMYVPYYYLNIKFFPLKWMSDLQEVLHTTLDKPWGILTQIAAVLLLYVALFILF